MMKFWMPVLACMTLLPVSADVRPLMHFNFAQADKNGTVPNLGTGPYQAKISGKYRITPEGILHMDGLTTHVVVEGSEDFDVRKNATFMLLYKRRALPDNSPLNQRCDGFFAKHREFVLTRVDNTLYTNIFYNGKWSALWEIGGIFTPQVESWHHITATLQYFWNKNESEKWVEITFYIDGVPSGRKRFSDIEIPHDRKKLEIGINSCMGPVWMTGGEIAEPRIYSGILSENQIQEIVLLQKLAKPGFKLDRVIPAEVLSEIDRTAASPACRSALHNIGRSDSANFKFMEILKAPGKYLTELRGKESAVVLLKTQDFAHIVSWFDYRTGRELLRHDNPFVSWTLEKEKSLTVLNPYEAQVKSFLQDQPVKKDGAWHFTIQYRHPDLSAEIAFSFNGKRIEFNHTARPENTGKMLYSASFPKVRLNPLKLPEEFLAVPFGCGIAYSNPTAQNIRYTQPYPRGFASMQLLAYYDKGSGIYIGCEDPRGRVKHIDASASEKSMNADFAWRVPYSVYGERNVFDPECRAALELFRGDWYDAGLIYRRELDRSNALWWRKKLPNTDAPDYFRNNALWVNITYLGEYEPNLVPLRDYFGQNYLLGDIQNWWDAGKSAALSPTTRAMPEWIEFVAAHRKKGLRLLPYIDGRLWCSQDRRGEDYLFSKIGHPLNVVSYGQPIRESYSPSIYSDVLCPATEQYQKIFFDYINTLISQGLDGLYVDQLGACYQPLCDRAKEHGHRYADWDAWNLNGYIRLLRNLRSHWTKQNRQVMLTTEDNAEWCVGLIDGLEVYRWASDGQIPLFPMVYSGRAQFYNRHAATREARYQTTAEQLNNGEQIGIFGVGELISPFNAELRKYVKRLVWIRTGLLDFFNEGMMGRPVTFRGEMKQVARFWSPFGTRNVAKPMVQGSCWKYDSCTAAVLVNTEAEPCSNEVIFEAPAEKSRIHVFEAGKKERSFVGYGKTVRMEFTLQPRGCMVLLAIPEGKNAEVLLKKFRSAFEQIQSTIFGKDPFSADNLPETALIDGSKGSNLTDSVLVIGARRNMELNRIDYVSYALLYPGVIEFGKKAPEKLLLETACGTPQGGKIKVFADGITQEHLIAEFVLSPDFRTAHWNDYRLLETPIRKKLTGKHKLIFLAEGLGFCNLKTWRLQ